MFSPKFNIIVGKIEKSKIFNVEVPEFEIHYIGEPRSDIEIGTRAKRADIEQNGKIDDDTIWELVEVRVSRSMAIIFTDELWQEAHWRDIAVGRIKK